MAEVIEVGASAGSVSLKEPTADSIYMFCYTSGTTGDPKAAMLSHSNLLAAAAASILTGVTIDNTSTIISYLPLAHSFEKFLFITALIGGGRIGYYSGDPLKILDDLQVLKPTVFPSVPRLFNRIYDRIIAGVKEQSASKQWLFNKAVSSKTYYHAKDASYTHKFYDTVIFKKMRNLLGGNVVLMCTGSAPINGDVLNYLKVVFGCPIIEGYGATESSAPITATW